VTSQINFRGSAEDTTILGVRGHAQSRCQGEAFRGLDPPNKTPSPPNSNMKHYKSIKILSMFRVSSPPAQTQSPPPKKCKAPLLKTFWRRFCACPREIFANYTEKYAFLCILEASFSIMFLRDLLTGETEN